ncbi:iron ABC transporter, partial [Klebsiella pneumoniae]
MIWHTFFQPFIEFGFMRRALVVCLALSLSTTMLGVFLLLRRMSLMGDALSHAILPGVAVGYLLSGMS